MKINFENFTENLFFLLYILQPNCVYHVIIFLSLQTLYIFDLRDALRRRDIARRFLAPLDAAFIGLRIERLAPVLRRRFEAERERERERPRFIADVLGVPEELIAVVFDLDDARRDLERDVRRRAGVAAGIIAACSPSFG